MLRYFFILGFACFTSSLCAQVDSTRIQRIEEVEVSAKAKPSNFQSTILLQVKTSEDLNRVGVLSVADAVRRLSGVNVKDYGGIGGLKTVSIRGLGAQHTTVSYDGVTVGEAQSGQVDIGRFSLENLSSISLSIGQADGIFLPARQFLAAGNLNLKTKDPEFKNKLYQGSFTVRGGSFGMVSPSLYYARKITNEWSVAANGGYKRADGTYRFKYDNGAYDEKRKRYNSDVDIWNTELNIYGNLKNAGNIQLKAYYYDSERGLPAPLINDNQYTGERVWDKDFFTQGTYENNLSNKFSVKGLAKFSRNYNKYFNKNINIGQQTDIYTQYEYYASGSVLYNPIDVLSFSLSQDYFHNKLDMNLDEITKGDANRNSWLTSFNGELRINRLTAHAGGLYTHVSGRQSEGVNPKDLNRFSPMFSLSYKPFDFNLRIRASYKDIFRVPSLNDVYYTRGASRALKPEKARQYNAGLVWTYNTSSFLDYLSVSLDGYVNKVKDKIVLFNASGYYWSMMNMGRVTIKGADLTINADMSLNSKLKFIVNGTYGYQDAKDDDTKQRPSYTPKHTGSFAFSFENPWLNISYTFVASDKRYSKPIIDSRYRIDSFIDQSISANKELKWNTYKLRLQGELLNIGNKNYQIVQSYPMPGRAFRLSGTFIF